MLHAPARRAVDRLLTGTGLAGNAVAVVAAAELQEWTACPAGLRGRLLDAACRLAPDHAPPAHHAALQERPPDDAGTLVARLGDLAAGHDRDPGMAWAALDALAALWPHAEAGERAGLRARLVSGLAALQPRGGTADGDLAAWAALAPACSSTVPAHADLLRLADDADPVQAYGRIARHLPRAGGLPPLIAALGGIAGQQLDRRTDPDGALWSVLVGTTACHRLAAGLGARQLAAATVRLGLQYWWGTRQGDPAPATERFADPDLPEAVQRGDAAAARRAARSLARDPERFWAAAWALLDGGLADRPEAVLRLAPLLAAVRRRCPDGLGPDDAAAIATRLALAGDHCIASS